VIVVASKTRAVITASFFFMYLELLICESLTGVAPRNSECTLDLGLRPANLGGCLSTFLGR
jgi:hypothetical protein